MQASRLIDSLEWFGGALPGMVSGIALDAARWKPADNAWSIREVMGHLLDEEVRDFRTRLRLVLEDPSQDWPPIDPEGWAIAERYNERHLAEVTRQWAQERRASVEWLRSLNAPDWTKSRMHPSGFLLRAGDLLVSWAAHDALHLRQIAKRIHQLAGQNGGEYSSRYAGEWKA